MGSYTVIPRYKFPKSSSDLRSDLQLEFETFKKKNSQFFSSRISLKISFTFLLKKFKLREAFSRAAAAPPEQPH